MSHHYEALGIETVAVAPWELLGAGLVIGLLVLIASRVVSFYDPDSLDDDDRGQLTGFPVPIVTIVVFVVLVVLVAEFGAGIIPAILLALLLVLASRVVGIIGPGKF